MVLRWSWNQSIVTIGEALEVYRRLNGRKESALFQGKCLLPLIVVLYTSVVVDSYHLSIGGL